jgi:hypothetical protein
MKITTTDVDLPDFRLKLAAFILLSQVHWSVSRVSIQLHIPETALVAWVRGGCSLIEPLEALQVTEAVSS